MSSINKKYYWMKLFDTFFQDARIKKLKRLAGGDTYVVITLKLMLQTIKTSGIYEFEGLEKSLAEELELKIDEDYKDIQVVLDYLNAHNMIIQVGTNDYEITQVKTMIGSETASTQRSRKSRESKKLLQCNTSATKSNTEIEIELKEEEENINIKGLKYSEIDSEIDRDMIFKLTGCTTDQQKIHLDNKIDEFVEHCAEKQKRYKNYNDSFARYMEIARQNGWNF